MIISKEFKSAVQDYFYLIGKSYPDKGSVKFVGDRYGLSGAERSMLYRGIHAKGLSDERRQKLVLDNSCFEQPLHIDTFNILFTLISYLEGRPLFLSTDALLRDASEWHGKGVKSGNLTQALDSLFDYLKEKVAGYLNFYIDQPMPESAQVQKVISAKMKEFELEGLASRFPYSDDMLELVRDGCLATSDSRIIDSSVQPVFDLAKAVLEYKFNPRFFDLTKIIF